MIRRLKRLAISVLPWGLDRRFIEPHIQRAKAAFYERMAEDGWLDTEVLRPEQLSALLDRDSSSGVCHIIGSGPSLLDSMTKIRPGEDRVIGFNYCALADIRFDLYLVELATDKSNIGRRGSDIQTLIIRHASDRIGKVGVTNLLSGKINRDYVKENYPPSTSLLYDFGIPVHLGSPYASVDRMCIRYLFAQGDDFIRKKQTSTLTAMVIAVNAGFDRIVLHGFDFFGPHFYCDASVAWPESIAQEDREKVIRTSLQPRIGHPARRVVPLIPHIQKHLEERHIRIFSASERSPLSRLLPVYEKRGENIAQR
uniref:Uncharacterized protein n=1 Tax=Candidatus Kentrum sp. DK TaxID=2126562 RepID=A0A450T0F7_9GAMM|nr:MAG: hypothetical protein BECKDK2373B_GA0170837_108814 [Candidatus Kentron sp. DK]